MTLTELVEQLIPEGCNEVSDDSVNALMDGLNECITSLQPIEVITASGLMGRDGREVQRTSRDAGCLHLIIKPIFFAEDFVYNRRHSTFNRQSKACKAIYIFVETSAERSWVAHINATCRKQLDSKGRKCCFEEYTLDGVKGHRVKIGEILSVSGEMKSHIHQILLAMIPSLEVKGLSGPRDYSLRHEDFIILLGALDKKMQDNGSTYQERDGDIKSSSDQCERLSSHHASMFGDNWTLVSKGEPTYQTEGDEMKDSPVDDASLVLYPIREEWEVVENEDEGEGEIKSEGNDESSGCTLS